MEAIFDQVLPVALILGMVLAGASTLAVLIGVSGSMLSRGLAFSNSVEKPHCSLCLWHLDKV